MTRSLSRLAALGLVAVTSCSSSTSSNGASSSWQSSTQSGTDATSGTEGERYFPLKHGTLYHYRTETLREGPVDDGMLMMKVHRASATRGELRRPAGNQIFEFTSQGIATTTKVGSPAFLLKLPIDPSTTWVGPHGGKTRFVETGLAVATQAGSFSGCVTTLEERGGDTPIRVQTTLCPDVGIAKLEVQSGGVVERAELVYFGPPFDIGPDGTQRVP